MALERKTQAFPLGQMGMNNSTDENVLPSNTLLSVDNMRYERNGLLVNRPGLSVNALGANTNTANVTKLFTTVDAKVGYVATDRLGYDLQRQIQQVVLSYEKVFTEPYRPFHDLFGSYAAQTYQWGPAENIQTAVIGNLLVICADHLGATTPTNDPIKDERTYWTAEGEPIYTDGIRTTSFGVFSLATNTWVQRPSELVLHNFAGFFTARPQILKASSTESRIEFLCIGHRGTALSGTGNDRLVPLNPTTHHEVVKGFVFVGGGGTFSVTTPSAFPASTTGLGGPHYNVGQFVVVNAGTKDYIVYHPFDGNSARIVECDSAGNFTVRVASTGRGVFQGAYNLVTAGHRPAGTYFNTTVQERFLVADIRATTFYNILANGSFSLITTTTPPYIGQSGRGAISFGNRDGLSFDLAVHRVSGIQRLLGSWQSYGLSSQGTFSVPEGDDSVQLYSQVFYPASGRSCVYLRIRNPDATPDRQDASLIAIELPSNQARGIIAQARYPTNESGMQAFYIADPRPTWDEPATVYTPVTIPTYNGVPIYCAIGAGVYNPTQGPASEVGIYFHKNGTTSVLPLRAGEVLIGSAAPSILDVTANSPLGFFINPYIEEIEVVEGEEEDAIFEAGTYGYCLVRKYTMPSGPVVRSTPTVPTFVEVEDSAEEFVVSAKNIFYNHGLFQAEYAPSVEVYRTQRDGQVFYYVDDYKETESIDFIDDIPDSELATRLPLYTTGGILPNDPMPPAKIMAFVNNRVFSVSPENPSRVYFSKTVQERQPVSFNASSYLDVFIGTGEITGLAALDDKLVVFKNRNIYVLAGEGPNDAGIGEFSPITEITSEYGCTNPASIVVNSDGVWFEFLQSIKLLTRSLQVQDVGLPVEKEMGTITSATFDPVLRELVFCTSNPALPETPTPWFTYSTLFKKWAVNYVSVSGARVLDVTATRAQGCTFLTQGVAGSFAENVQRILRADKNATTDLYPFVTLFFDQFAFLCRLITGFIGFDEITGGYGRLYRVSLIGSVKGANVQNNAEWFSGDVKRPTLLVRTNYNKGVIVDEITLGTAATIEAEQPIVLVKSRVNTQIAHSYQFEVKWKSDTSRRLALYALLLELGVKPGIAHINTITK